MVVNMQIKVVWKKKSLMKKPNMNDIVKKTSLQYGGVEGE
jgi:hypothetical protein